MNFLTLLPIAIAVSLDSFGVGVTYGARRLRVPLSSLAIITLCTGTTLIFSVWVGEIIVALLSPRLTEVIGGIMLIGIGVFAVLNHVKSQLNRSSRSRSFDLEMLEESVKSDTAGDSPESESEHESLSVIPEILNDPMAADFDHSNSISLSEAVFLGLALSMDSFVAGISIRLLGYSPWLIILTIAMMSSIFLFLGIQTGILIAGHRWFRQLPYFPSTMLIVIGLHKLF
ncbi:sporulation membrane protein YtaF [Candidatus Synechococcus calcipolaris G9]|uniref:Sporulation membrane protein YtaF n=1 Tax=Candidatus Synechococcus calcipolaris G9 TaxID=1497997 RepID=A0ABT6EXT9_9SYNE|nr:sporulation membrane protein YtaF [Candidatus Synechococcus calcipolaris]MDG2990627.1 sporulation membrane protein YtaF [Candidatus Synechococcus calcipolaris G9]